MQYQKLGNTGLEVSRICVGCMGFGDPAWVHKWVLGEAESRVVIKHALDLGVNFFDTANVYSLGVSEEILGRALRDYADRDRMVVATKVNMRMADGPNGAGLSRKAIMSEIDRSLQRLGMDYVDVYIIHRWDATTPIEETMEALHDVVKAGKTRYIGASAMYAWQFQKALATAEKHGWTKFVSMQNHYNLLYREEEREMMPLCVDAKIAVTPYSPLAAGRLTRDWSADSSPRAQSDTVANWKYDRTTEVDKAVVERVAEVAQRMGVTRTQVALAWLLSRPQVAAPIIGATKTSHLDEAVTALDVTLSAADIAYMEAPYLPHTVVGPA